MMDVSGKQIQGRVIQWAKNVGQHNIAALPQLSSVCPLKKGMSNHEVSLSEQSINECDSSLLLMID